MAGSPVVPMTGCDPDHGQGETHPKLSSPWWFAASYRSVVTATGEIARRRAGCATAASSCVIAK